MKIITQSTTLAKQPYFHLAYLAASSRTPQGSLLSFGILFMLVGFVMTVKPVKDKAKTGLSSVHLTLRKTKPLPIVIAGLISMFVGLVFLITSFKSGELIYRNPQSMTNLNLKMLRQIVSTHLQQGEPIPESIPAMREQWELDDKTVKDGYFNQFRIKSIDGAGTAAYQLIGARADGKFETEDDVKSELIFRHQEKGKTG